jgi:hypothetical protein
MKLRVFLFLFAVVILPSHSFAARNCSSLFETDSKTVILDDAIFQGRLEIDKTSKQYAKALKSWDLDNSTPAKMETLAQSLVLKLEKRTFAQWLKGLIFKGEATKAAVRVRAETLILKRELLDALEVRGLLKKDSRLDKYRTFRKAHFNKIQLAKMVAFNSATIYFLGLPLYFPNFNWIHNLDLTEKDLDLVMIKGFNNAYPTILSNYKKELRINQVSEQAPQILFLSMMTYAAYNYLDLKVAENHYAVPVNESIPQSNQLFIQWKKDYEERSGHVVDMKNAQDRKAWDTTVQSIYRAWADMFNEKEGPYPDLSKPQDRQAWEKFLSSLDF